MQRISVYIPDDTRQRINLIAKSKRQAESEVIRDALDEGLNKLHPKGGSAQTLLDLAEKAKEILIGENLPTDLSVNHDYYAWGGKKRSK